MTFDPSPSWKESSPACWRRCHSSLAFLGLRYPVAMLPILLFEVTWKVIWIGAVAIPHAVAGDMDAGVREVLVSCSLIVVAVVPWRVLARDLRPLVFVGGCSRRVAGGNRCRRFRRSPTT
jgi:hypothetical protein